MWNAVARVARTRRDMFSSVITQRLICIPCGQREREGGGGELNRKRGKKERESNGCHHLHILVRERAAGRSGGEGPRIEGGPHWTGGGGERGRGHLAPYCGRARLEPSVSWRPPPKQVATRSASHTRLSMFCFDSRLAICSSPPPPFCACLFLFIYASIFYEYSFLFK